MNESKIYLEKFIDDYNKLFKKTDNGELEIKNYNHFADFLNNYGLINTNKKNYKKINFFKQNVKNLLSLPTNDKNSEWLENNICEIVSIFSQIQIDLPIPDQGHYMYINYENPQGIAASGYLMHFSKNIEETLFKKTCKFGEECKRCNPIHFEQFYHPRTFKKTNLRDSRKYDPINRNKKGGKKTRKNHNINKNDVKKIIDKFLYYVTQKKNAESLNKLFCNDGLLIATLSRKTRKKNKKYNIKNYFKYFTNLEGIKILSKHYNIQKIDNDVFLNQATIKWKWNAIKEPVVARMTFIIRNKCIFLLHSSSLQESN